VQYLVLVRTVHTHILSRAVVGNLIVESGKFRHLDEVAETFLLYDVVRHVELEIRRLLGEYSRPSVKTAYVLPFQLLRAQVLEQQVQLRQRVGNGRARKERGSQVLSRALLYGAYGKEHIESLLTPFRVSKSRHTVMACVESQVLELVALVYKNVVDAHLPEIYHVIRA